MLMKFLNKTAVKRILLIVLCALVVLPFILDLMKVEMKEGFSGTPQAASDYESNNIKINRIITAKGENFDATNANMTEADVSYAYCISAQDTDMTCKSANAELDISYTDLSFSYGNGMFGSTYDSSCSTTTTTTDEEGNETQTKTYFTDLSFQCVTIGNGLPASIYGLESNEETSQYGVSKDMKLELTELSSQVNADGETIYDNYSGFTQNMSSLPLQFDESGDLNMFYSGNEEYVKTLKCFLFDTSGNCETALGNAYATDNNEDTETDSETVTDDEDNEKKCDDPVNIKCLAHFGTKVGEPLCCGQTGVLQNTSHVCPQELPTCSGYKCGSQWGVCTK